MFKFSSIFLAYFSNRFQIFFRIMKRWWRVSYFMIAVNQSNWSSFDYSCRFTYSEFWQHVDNPLYFFRFWNIFPWYYVNHIMSVSLFLIIFSNSWTTFAATTLVITFLIFYCISMFLFVSPLNWLVTPPDLFFHICFFCFSAWLH